MNKFLNYLKYVMSCYVFIINAKNTYVSSATQKLMKVYCDDSLLFSNEFCDMLSNKLAHALIFNILSLETYSR